MSGIKHKSTNVRMSSPIKQYVIVLDDRSEVMTERKKEKEQTMNKRKTSLRVKRTKIT